MGKLFMVHSQAIKIFGTVHKWRDLQKHLWSHPEQTHISPVCPDSLLSNQNVKGLGFKTTALFTNFLTVCVVLAVATVLSGSAVWAHRPGWTHFVLVEAVQHDGAFVCTHLQSTRKANLVYKTDKYLLNSANSLDSASISFYLFVFLPQEDTSWNACRGCVL